MLTNGKAQQFPVFATLSVIEDMLICWAWLTCSETMSPPVHLVEPRRTTETWSASTLSPDPSKTTLLFASAKSVPGPSTVPSTHCQRSSTRTIEPVPIFTSPSVEGRSGW